MLLIHWFDFLGQNQLLELSLIVNFSGSLLNEILGKGTCLRLMTGLELLRTTRRTYSDREIFQQGTVLHPLCILEESNNIVNQVIQVSPHLYLFHIIMWLYSLLTITAALVEACPCTFVATAV